MSIMKLAIIAIFVVEAILPLSTASSSTTGKKVGDYYCADLTDLIYGENSLQYRMDDFGNYDVDKQYAIFICGNQFVHPPMMYLAELLAKEGDKIVGFLKTKLREAGDDLTIRDLVRVFADMNRLKTYDVASDEELMRLISERLEGMKDPGWKQITRRMASRIK
jgi:hypothetical protein